jgi:hypothetical protein
MDYPYKPDSGQWTYLDCMEVDVIEVVVKTIDGNPFGQVVSASITLRGLSQPLGALWKVKNLHFNPEWKKTLPSTEDICVFMDFDQTPPQLLEKGRDIFLLQVARFNTYSDTYVVRLNDLPEDQPTSQRSL